MLSTFNVIVRKFLPLQTAPTERPARTRTSAAWLVRPPLLKRPARPTTCPTLPPTMSRAGTTDLFLRPIAGGSPASPCTPPLVLRRHCLLILTASESHPWPLALISTACTRHLKRGGGTNRAQTGSPPPCSDGHVPAGGNGDGTLSWVATRRMPHTSQPPPRFPDPSIGSGEVLEEATQLPPCTPSPAPQPSPPRLAASHAASPRRPASRATRRPEDAIARPSPFSHGQLTCATSCLGSARLRKPRLWQQQGSAAARCAFFLELPDRRSHEPAAHRALIRLVQRHAQEPLARAARRQHRQPLPGLLLEQLRLLRRARARLRCVRRPGALACKGAG